MNTLLPLLVLACAPSTGSLQVGDSAEPSVAVGDDGSGAWPSACPLPLHQADCTRVERTDTEPPTVARTTFDAQGREVEWTLDDDGDGAIDLSSSTSWEGSTRVELQHLPDGRIARAVTTHLRDDGQVGLQITDDRLEVRLTERELRYDALGRVVSDVWRRNDRRIETCTSLWTSVPEGWLQEETCTSPSGTTRAHTTWDVGTRLPLTLVWNRDAQGPEEWTATTAYRDDCQVAHDQQELPAAEGYDRFVTTPTYDADGLLVQSVLEAVDDDGALPTVQTVTTIEWECP